MLIRDGIKSDRMFGQSVQNAEPITIRALTTIVRDVRGPPQRLQGIEPTIPAHVDIRAEKSLVQSLI